MKPTHLLWISLVATAGLAAYENAADFFSEPPLRPVAESPVSKEATRRQVDASDGVASKVAVAAGLQTDADVQVTGADLGVPFYPGTTPRPDPSSWVTTPAGTSFNVELHTDDPTDKVAAFYRDHLAAQSDGKQFMDMSTEDGQTTLMLADDRDQIMIQVHVTRSNQGSDIQIITSRDPSYR